MFGKDKKDASTASALEQAKSVQEDQGFVGGKATALIEKLLDVGIDGKGPFDSASEVATAALREENGQVEKAVKAIVKSHMKLAMASGFVTSLGGFITMPVALPVNVAGFYVLATRMVAAVAKVRGYDLAEPQIRSAVLLSLVGADADDLLSKAGVAVPSGRLTSLAVERLPGPALMVVNKAIGFRILSTSGKSVFKRFGKGVPVVGGVVGAGLDGWILNKIADKARADFVPVAGQITTG